MTDSQLTIIVAVIPTTIAAFASLMQNLKTSAKAEVVSAKADTIIKKASEIQISTDGTLSHLRAELSVASEKISGLEKLLAVQSLPRDIPGPPGPPGETGPQGPQGPKGKEQVG